MKVTVIIPAHNREDYIETAIRSLLRQRNDADLDILVIDDGSTDLTAEIVLNLRAAEGDIRLIRQEKAGVARARNRGMENIHPAAEFVTFLDSDDVSVTGRFAEELPLLREDPDLAMTYSKMTLTDAIDDARFISAEGARTCTLHGISLTTALFRRSAIESMGRFDESFRLAEDWDFLLRFFELSPKYRLLDHVAILYRRHAGNTTKAKDEAQKHFIRALLLSAQRRRRSVHPISIPKFFDLTELLAVEHEALR